VVVNPENEDELVGILTRSDVMRDVMTTVAAALPEMSTFDVESSESEEEDETIEIHP